MPEDDDDQADSYKVVNEDEEIRENAEALSSEDPIPSSNAIFTDYEHEHKTVELLDVL